MLATSMTRAQTMMTLRSSVNRRRQILAGAVPDVIHRLPRHSGSTVYLSARWDPCSTNKSKLEASWRMTIVSSSAQCGMCGIAHLRWSLGPDFANFGYGMPIAPISNCQLVRTNLKGLQDAHIRKVWRSGSDLDSASFDCAGGFCC
jgi:hypothetical protein